VRVRLPALLMFCVFLTAVDLYFVRVKLSDLSYSQSVAEAQGVVNGTPRLRINQSRILGPHLVQAIAGLLATTPSRALMLFGALCLLGAKLIVVWFRVRDQSAAPTLLMLIAGSGMFALLVHRYVFPWDFAGLMIFTAFVVMVLRKVAWPWFVPLIAVAFLNRESAAFLCVWLSIHGILNGTGERSRFLQVGAGLCLATLGLLFVNSLRTVAVVQEASNLGPKWLMFMLRWNLVDLVNAIHTGNIALPLFFGVLLLGMGSAAIVGIRHFPKHTALCVCFTLEMVFILLFGIVDEPRVMIELIPFYTVFLPSLLFDGSSTRTVQ